MPEDVIMETTNPNGMSPKAKAILVAVTGGAIVVAAVVFGIIWKKRHPKVVASSTEQ